MPRDAKVGATRSSHVYTLRLPDDLRSQWASYCERNDKKAAATLRALMRYLIQDDMPPEVQHWVTEQVEGDPDNGPKQRMEVRFTPTEYQSIKSQAEAEGCSPQRWVINCVRASLTHEPQFTMETTKALTYCLRAAPAKRSARSCWKTQFCILFCAYRQAFFTRRALRQTCCFLITSRPARMPGRKTCGFTTIVPTFTTP